MTNLFKPIKVLKGVAEKRAKLYENIGVYTPFDLLYHFPRNYIDYRNPVCVSEAKLNENNVVSGLVLKKVPEQRIRQGLSIYKVLVTDGIDNFYVVFYAELRTTHGLFNC